jgi:hypothetical protein
MRNQLEDNIINSFKLAKRDIINLKSEVIRLSEQHQRFVEMLKNLNIDEIKLNGKVNEINSKKDSQPKTRVVRIIKTIPKAGKRAHKFYVANKNGTKFHIKDCPFAQNIKPKNTIKFNSKNKALNRGLKPCKCVK